MLRKSLLLLCLLLCTYESSCYLDMILKLGKKVWQVTEKFGEIKTNIDGTKSLIDGLFLWEESENLEVLNKIGELSTQLGGIEKNMEHRFNVLEHLIEDVPYKTQIDGYTNSFRQYIERIDNQYDLFKLYVTRGENSTSDLWKDFARSSIKVINDNLLDLRILLVAQPSLDIWNKGLIIKMANRTAELGDRFCHDTQSFHHFVNQMLDLVMMVEMKGLIVLSASYPTAYPLSEVKWLFEYAQRKLEERYMMYLRASSTGMEMTRPSIIRCDPANLNWVRGESYFEMEKLDQLLFLPPFDSHLVTDCFHLDSTSFKELKRHYPDMKEECDGGDFGGCDIESYKTCRINDPVRNYKWAASIGFWGQETPYGMGYPDCYETYTSRCQCECDKPHENSVSLKMVTTDTQHNMVVTGARLVRKDKVVWVQLKQGKLLPNAQIDSTTQSWVPIPDDGDFPKQYVSRSNSRFLLAHGKTLPPGYALTGVQFVGIRPGEGVTIAFRGHKMDLQTGALLPDIVTFNERPQSIKYEGWDARKYNPVLNKGATTNDWVIREVRVGMTERDNDLAQSAAPFFDSQPIETNPPSPLGGVGLFHKHSDKSSGFISLVLHSLPYAEMINKLITNYVNGTMFKKST